MNDDARRTSEGPLEIADELAAIYSDGIKYYEVPSHVRAKCRKGSETIESLRADLRTALGCWANAMPQELFANNQANRGLYDSLARKVGMKPMRLGRTDAEYQALCVEWGVTP